MNKQQIIAVILIGAGLLAGTFLVYKNEQFRDKMQAREKLGSISFERGDNFGDIKTVNLIISTGDLDTQNEAFISSISIKAKLGNTGEKLEFVDNLHQPALGVTLSDTFADNGEWLFPVNTIYQKDGQYYLDFVAVNTSTSGFSALTPVRLGTVFIKSSLVDTPDFTLVAEDTKMMSKNKPVINILP